MLSLGNFTDAIHTNLDLLTLSNVYPGSQKMWLHLASVYIITLVALKVMNYLRISDVAPAVITAAAGVHVQQAHQAESGS